MLIAAVAKAPEAAEPTALVSIPALGWRLPF